MERLTKYLTDDCAVLDCTACPYHNNGCHTMNCRNRLIEKLAAYEDTGLEPEDIISERPWCVFYSNRKCNLNGDFCAEGPGCPWETSPERAKKLLEVNKMETAPNDPLTLDELREMNGEPVWVKSFGQNPNASWGIVDNGLGYVSVSIRNGHYALHKHSYGFWLAYRRKLEEAECGQL